MKTFLKLGMQFGLPLLLMAAVLIAAVMLARLKVANEKEMRARIEARQQENRRLGLPLDYPLELVPVYPGADIIEATRGQTKSEDGAPMDLWELHCETDDVHFDVAEFYRKRLLAVNMSQKMLASLPNGVAETYADETTEVEFTAEKLKADIRTQIRITIARLQTH